MRKLVSYYIEIRRLNRIMEKMLESQEFYELMQTYRNAPISNQYEVIKAFQLVKIYILECIDNTKKERGVEL